MDDSPTRMRRHRRVSKELPVQMTTIDAEPDPRTGRPCFRNVREYSGNLSRGGIFVRTQDSFTPGHRVLVQFHVPGRGEVEAVGRVAWSRKVLTGAADDDAGVGIAFESRGGVSGAALDAIFEEDGPSD